MPIQVRPLLPVFLPLVLACSVEQEICSDAASPAVPAAAITPTEAGRSEVIEVDTTPPTPLTRWREIKRIGEEAARAPELEARIAQCRAFVSQHPDHQTVALVLEALADALIEKGGFDAAELATHLEALAKRQESAEAPTRLVERYHLKHGLSGASAMALLTLARARLIEEERARALLKDEDSRAWKERHLAFERATTYIAEARLHLRDGALDQAKRAIAGGRADADRVVKDIILQDARGQVQRTLGAGVLEELHVLAAEVMHRQGNDMTARLTLGQVLGAMENTDVRRMYDRLRVALALDAGDRVVKAPAQPAQDFTLKSLTGASAKLSDHRGKVVLVAFFATWCEPCKRELPRLVKFRDDNRAKGVELLVVSIDDFNGRSRVAPFLSELGLDLPVLLEDPAQLTSYDYTGGSALYVIDRAGAVVHARTGYTPGFEDTLTHDVQALVDDPGAGGRPLLTIEHAPAGWDVLWQRPIAGDFYATAVASPLGSAGGEVGVVGREGLMRWTADGQPLASQASADYTLDLDATDLDGDGKREWITAGYRGIRVFDHDGALYWQHDAEHWITVAGHRDFDGDGSQELLLRAGDRAIMMKSVPEPMWTSGPFKELTTVHLDPTGGLVLQADRQIFRLDARGTITAQDPIAPRGRTLRGRVVTEAGPVNVFAGAWDPTPDLDHDFDGDGRTDVLLAKHTGLVVYDTEGASLLRLRSRDARLTAALGELDGKPGAELVVLVEHYGVVVLGKRD